MTFIEKRVRTINAMQAVLKEYEHPASGARHIHLATDDPEMVFLVAFPTVPDKDDGRAHILEHLALGEQEVAERVDAFLAAVDR